MSEYWEWVLRFLGVLVFALFGTGYIYLGVYLLTYGAGGLLVLGWAMFVALILAFIFGLPYLLTR
jgi:uncharacterized membrane protein